MNLIQKVVKYLLLKEMYSHVDFTNDILMSNLLTEQLGRFE